MATEGGGELVVATGGAAPSPGCRDVTHQPARAPTDSNKTARPGTAQAFPSHPLQAGARPMLLRIRRRSAREAVAGGITAAILVTRAKLSLMAASQTGHASRRCTRIASASSPSEMPSANNSYDSGGKPLHGKIATSLVIDIYGVFRITDAVLSPASHRKSKFLVE